MKEIAADCAKAMTLRELHAQAKALSASEKRTPPWQTLWPLVMFSLTTIEQRAQPSPAPSMTRPKVRVTPSVAWRCSAMRRASASSFDKFIRAPEKLTDRAFNYIKSARSSSRHNGGPRDAGCNRRRWQRGDDGLSDHRIRNP